MIVHPISLLALVAGVLAAPPSEMWQEPYDPIAACPDRADAAPDQLVQYQISFYGDENRVEAVQRACYYAGPEVDEWQSGQYFCARATIPDGDGSLKVWGKRKHVRGPDVQVAFTKDQSCPPNSPGAVFPQLAGAGACMFLAMGGDQPRVTVFPKGGSPILKVEDGVVMEQRQESNTKCSGFTTESQELTSTGSKQVSNAIDCTNAVKDMGWVLSVEATFGVKYTQETTSGLQNGFTVPKGQKGYITTYSSATQFNGRYTGCDQGDTEQPGSVIALKKNGLSYILTLTGSRDANGTLFEE